MPRLIIHPPHDLLAKQAAEQKTARENRIYQALLGLRDDTLTAHRVEQFEADILFIYDVDKGTSIIYKNSGSLIAVVFIGRIDIPTKSADSKDH